MIPLPNPTKVIEKNGNKATFEVDALYPGYGVTIGNSMRRILLSSLEGAAAVKVKIEGVSHEFSTIPGMTEDVLTVLLGLKKLRFTLHTEEPQKITLNAKGEGEVKGSDFELSPQVELLNPEIVIARLTTKDAKLKIEVEVRKGIGYVPSELLKGEKEEIGVLTLDGIFTPVRNVSYQVERMRVGERTDFDRLLLELETDGSMTPEKAFYEAASILEQQCQVVLAGVRDAVEAQSAKEQEEKKAKPEKKQETKKKTPAKEKTTAKPKTKAKKK